MDPPITSECGPRVHPKYQDQANSQTCRNIAHSIPFAAIRASEVLDSTLMISRRSAPQLLHAPNALILSSHDNRLVPQDGGGLCDGVAGVGGSDISVRWERWELGGLWYYGRW